MNRVKPGAGSARPAAWPVATPPPGVLHGRGWYNAHVELDLTVRGSVEALRLEPGDLVVVAFDDHVPHEYIASVRAELRNRFPENDVLVFANGVRLQRMRLVEA
jgi:hypothetical protein